MQHVAIKTISTSAIADILINAKVDQTVDTGATIVQTLVHEQLGNVTVITNALEEVGIVMVAPEVVSLLPN